MINVNKILDTNIGGFKLFDEAYLIEDYPTLETCPMCNGTKKIDVLINNDTSETIECVKCKGKGKIKGEGEYKPLKILVMGFQINGCVWNGKHLDKVYLNYYEFSNIGGLNIWRKNLNTETQDIFHTKAEALAECKRRNKQPEAE